MTAQEVLDYIDSIDDETPLGEIGQFYNKYKREYKSMSPDEKFILSRHWDKLEMLFMLGS